MPAETNPLSILCFGAGAIGTYIGGSLALSGHRVVFIERPDVIPELRERGLRLRLNGEERVVGAPRMATSLDEALGQGPFDTALLAVKSFDTAALAESLAPYAVALPPVLSLQNGVENEAALAKVLGKERVIAGTVTTAVSRRGVGDVAVEKLRGTGIGSNHLLSPVLVNAFNAAGLKAQAFNHPQGMKWSKMLTNLIGNATSAILDWPPGRIYAHPGLFRLEMEQLREALRVMRALGYPVVNLPGTPVRLLAWAIWRLPAAVSRPLLVRAVGGGRGEKMPSFHVDLAMGRTRSEVGYLNGAVVRFGQQAGVPAPVNRLLTDTLEHIVRGEIPRAEFAGQPEKLLALWRQSSGR